MPEISDLPDWLPPTVAVVVFGGIVLVVLLFPDTKPDLGVERGSRATSRTCTEEEIENEAVAYDHRHSIIAWNRGVETPTTNTTVALFKDLDEAPVLTCPVEPIAGTVEMVIMSFRHRKICRQNDTHTSGAYGRANRWVVIDRANVVDEADETNNQIGFHQREGDELDPGEWMGPFECGA